MDSTTANSWKPASQAESRTRRGEQVARESRPCLCTSRICRGVVLHAEQQGGPDPADDRIAAQRRGVAVDEHDQQRAEHGRPRSRRARRRSTPVRAEPLHGCRLARPSRPCGQGRQHPSARRGSGWGCRALAAGAAVEALTAGPSFRVGVRRRRGDAARAHRRRRKSALVTAVAPSSGAMSAREAPDSTLARKASTTVSDGQHVGDLVQPVWQGIPWDVEAGEQVDRPLQEVRQRVGLSGQDEHATEAEADAQAARVEAGDRPPGRRAGGRSSVSAPKRVRRRRRQTTRAGRLNSMLPRP